MQKYIYQNIYQIVEKGWWGYAERVFSSATPGAHVQFKAKRSRNQEQMRNTGSMMDCNPLETVQSESGSSVKAAGFKVIAETKPGTWHKYREREWQPVYGQLKLRWEIESGESLFFRNSGRTRSI